MENVFEGTKYDGKYVTVNDEIVNLFGVTEDRAYCAREQVMKPEGGFFGEMLEYFHDGICRTNRRYDISCRLEADEAKLDEIAEKITNIFMEKARNKGDIFSDSDKIAFKRGVKEGYRNALIG